MHRLALQRPNNSAHSTQPAGCLLLSPSLSPHHHHHTHKHPTQGALAPVLASCSLFGIYLLLKYFPDLSLQTLLDGYFWLLGTAAITGAARPLLRRLAPASLGKPSLCWDVPEGWLLDEEGKAIEQVC